MKQSTIKEEDYFYVIKLIVYDHDIYVYELYYLEFLGRPYVGKGNIPRVLKLDLK